MNEFNKTRRPAMLRSGGGKYRLVTKSCNASIKLRNQLRNTYCTRTLSPEARAVLRIAWRIASRI